MVYFLSRILMFQKKNVFLHFKNHKKMKSFADYKKDAPNWITLANGEFYPDILESACELYKPVLILFGQLIKTSESSERLFKE